MARGAEAKARITNDILKTFEGAFLYNGGKEIRVNTIENGEQVQIKIVLTAAKTNVQPEGGTVLTEKVAVPTEQTNTVELATPNEEEVQNLKNALESLGLADAFV